MGEAFLEEGASEVWFVESDRLRAQELASKFGKQNVFKADAWAWLQKNPEVFDIIFADPPFEDWRTNSFALKELSLHTHLDSFFVVKSPKRMVPFPAMKPFYLWKESTFGDSRLLYYRHG